MKTTRRAIYIFIRCCICCTRLCTHTEKERGNLKRRNFRTAIRRQRRRGSSLAGREKDASRYRSLGNWMDREPCGGERTNANTIPTYVRARSSVFLCTPYVNEYKPQPALASLRWKSKLPKRTHTHSLNNSPSCICWCVYRTHARFIGDEYNWELGHPRCS